MGIFKNHALSMSIPLSLCLRQTKESKKVELPTLVGGAFKSAAFYGRIKLS